MRKTSKKRPLDQEVEPRKKTKGKNKPKKDTEKSESKFDEGVLQELSIWDEEKYNLLNDSDKGSKKHNRFYRTISNNLEELRVGASGIGSGFLAFSASPTETISNFILSILSYAALVHGVSISGPTEVAKNVIKYISDKRRKKKAKKISDCLNDHNLDFREERIRIAYSSVIRYWEPLERLGEDSAGLVADLAIKRMKCYLEEYGKVALGLLQEGIDLYQQLPISINIMQGITPGIRNFKINPEYKEYGEMYVASFFDKGGIKVISPTGISLYLSQDEEIRQSASRYLFRIGTPEEAKYFNMVKLSQEPEWYKIKKIAVKEDEESSKDNPKIHKEILEIKKQIDTLVKVCKLFGNSKTLEPAIIDQVYKLFGEKVPKPVAINTVFQFQDEKGKAITFREIKAEPNGNCLFESLYNGLKVHRSSQLNLFEINEFSGLRKFIADKLRTLADEKMMAGQTIRQMVFDQIAEIIRGGVRPVGYPEDLKQWLLDCQASYKTYQKDALNDFIEKNALPAYLDAISKNHTWGDIIEMHVASHIFKIKIVVYNESKIDPITIIGKNYSDKIDLYHRDNGTHYWL